MPDENGVPTTFEMDGLFTAQDIERRHICHKQCTDCFKWTKFDIRDKDVVCENCGSTKFDIQSTISDRTFDPIKAAKRRPGKKER